MIIKNRPTWLAKVGRDTDRLVQGKERAPESENNASCTLPIFASWGGYHSFSSRKNFKAKGKLLNLKAMVQKLVLFAKGPEFKVKFKLGTLSSVTWFINLTDLWFSSPVFAKFPMKTEMIWLSEFGECDAFGLHLLDEPGGGWRQPTLPKPLLQLLVSPRGMTEISSLFFSMQPVHEQLVLDSYVFSFVKPKSASQEVVQSGGQCGLTLSRKR